MRRPTGGCQGVQKARNSDVSSPLPLPPYPHWKIETSWRAFFFLPAFSGHPQRAILLQVCVYVYVGKERAFYLLFFGVTFVFVLGTRSLVCALAQALCLTITTKAVTLRICRVLSSTAAAAAGAGAVSSVTFLDSSASTHASESLLSQARSLSFSLAACSHSLSLSCLDFCFLF